MKGQKGGKGKMGRAGDKKLRIFEKNCKNIQVKTPEKTMCHLHSISKYQNKDLIILFLAWTHLSTNAKPFTVSFSADTYTGQRLIR